MSTIQNYLSTITKLAEEERHEELLSHYNQKKNNMEQKDFTFLALDGKIKTTTGAQRIKDAAGAYIASIKSELDNISFINQSVKIVGERGEDTTQVGWDLTKLQSIKSKLAQIIEAQSLQAWLGEAIAAKTRIQESINTFTIQDYAEKTLATIPTQPTRPSIMTENEWLATLSVKERNEYYTLETVCAVYGQFIHPNRPFDRAKKELYQKALDHKTQPEQFGSVVLIYRNSASVNVDSVESIFFDLQNTYNSNQARLNGFKNRYKIAADEKFNAEFKDYHNDMLMYNRDIKSLEDECLAWKRAQQAEFDKLKIVIPNSLIGIYETISKLGKHQEE